MKDNRTSVKRSLLVSAIALTLTAALLIGTTFAWFTSNAATGVSTVQSGKLEIQLLDANGRKLESTDTLSWQKAQGHENDPVYWEPGCTYKLQPVTIKNNGNLSLKYRIIIKGLVGDEGLNKVITWSYTDSGNNTVALETDRVLSAGKSDTLIISGTMDSDADNDYQEKSITGVSIAVQATQYTDEYDSNGNSYDAGAEYENSDLPNTATVSTAAELKAVLTSFTDAGSGNSVVTINNDITLKEGETWTPVTVDGYRGAGVIVINGNGHTITGLNDALFSGGFAGSSGIVINDLTLDKVNINNSNESLGLGAFINTIDSMPRIELSNCHLTNSTIVSKGGARVGGLIGWTSGYNVSGNGPVDCNVIIKNCSVESSNITANGSAGGIIGHAGNNPATYHTIEGCKVENTNITSTDAATWRTGVIVGTANVGEVTITNCTSTNNTAKQESATETNPNHELYGRFVPGNTGKLTINGVQITN